MIVTTFALIKTFPGSAQKDEYVVMQHCTIVAGLQELIVPPMRHGGTRCRVTEVAVKRVNGIAC